LTVKGEVGSPSIVTLHVTQFKYFVKYINDTESCYEVLGYSAGAGTSKETTLVIYQDTSTKQLYHRTFDDFCQKMIPF